MKNVKETICNVDFYEKGKNVLILDVYIILNRIIIEVKIY